METQTINMIQDKVNRVRKSCVTPEQKQSFKRYKQLYLDMMARYEGDFQYQMKVDSIMFTSTGFFIGVVVGTVLFGLLDKIF